MWTFGLRFKTIVRQNRCEPHQGSLSIQERQTITVDSHRKGRTAEDYCPVILLVRGFVSGVGLGPFHGQQAPAGRKKRQGQIPRYSGSRPRSSNRP